MKMDANPLSLAADLPKLDLSRNVENKENIEKSVFETNMEKFGSLKELFQHILQSIENNLRFWKKKKFWSNIFRDPNDNSLRKILISNLFTKLCSIKYTEKELIQFIYSLKVFIKSSYCTVLITIPSALNEQTKTTLIKNSDVSFKIQQIFGFNTI